MKPVRVVVGRSLRIAMEEDSREWGANVISSMQLVDY